MGKEAGYPGWYADFHSVRLFSESCSLLSLPPSAVSLPQLCLNLNQRIWCNLSKL